jgi:hypothetical protein
MSQGDDREAACMEQLEAQVRAHVEADEQALMPRLRAAADGEALAALAIDIDRGKRTAPTRPHPAAPDKPPALAMAAPVVALYDRLRDRLQGRPQT